MSSEWFSAKCLIGLDGMSNAVQVINRKALQENWQCRPRRGKGGGKEYHISSLPASRVVTPPSQTYNQFWLGRSLSDLVKLIENSS